MAIYSGQRDSRSAKPPGALSISLCQGRSCVTPPRYH